MNLIHSMPFLNKHKQILQRPAASCNSLPKTQSFRATDVPTFNKDSLLEQEVAQVTTLGSLFTNSSETASISSESDSSAVEMIVRGARSERLFFEPDSTSSIVESRGICKREIGGVAVEMESDNPYVDFKKSMEEMVEVYGLRDWECLEELLGWYLRVNEKDCYEYIIGAFVDLLVGISGGGGGGSDGGVMCLDDVMDSFSSGASSFSSHASSPEVKGTCGEGEGEGEGEGATSVL